MIETNLEGGAGTEAPVIDGPTITANPTKTTSATKPIRTRIEHRSSQTQPAHTEPARSAAFNQHIRAAPFFRLADYRSGAEHALSPPRGAAGLVGACLGLVALRLTDG
jgi:hypothetical protein